MAFLNPNFDWFEWRCSAGDKHQTQENCSLFLLHKLQLNKMSFKQGCLWDQAFSLFPEILFFNAYEGCVCVFSLSFFSFFLFFFLMAFCLPKVKKQK